MTATQGSHFLNGAFARLISLIFAVSIAYVLYANWGSQIAATLKGQPSSVAVVKAPAGEANPALDACLAQRVGDVETMKSDGIINDAQYSQFKSRAMALCRARNPGGR